jgi:hypothetical protein
VQLTSGDDEALIAHLDLVRRAFGGDYGIWESMQDSLGSYVCDDDGRVINYHVFCQQLADEATAPWYHRVLEFFHDFHMKTTDERREIGQALDDVAEFLERKPRETGKGNQQTPSDADRRALYPY